MRHRFKKQVFRYLLEIVSNGDATNKIIEDLSRQTSNAGIQYQLCVSALKILDGNKFIRHNHVEKVIDFVCNNVKRVGVYDKETASKILNLILTDSIVKRAYAEIAEAFVYILDDKDRDKAEAVLKQAFNILKGEMEDRTKMIMISENASEGINREEYFTCSTLDFIRLAFVWINTSQDKSYAVNIVNFGSQYAIGFTEYLELAEFYIYYPEERYTAIKYFRKAEEQSKDFDDCCCLFHDLTLLVKNDVWAMQIFNRCRNLARSADDFTRLGEILGNKNGLPNMKLCREMFAIAMEKATTDEKRCVQDSWENVQEEHEQD